MSIEEDIFNSLLNHTATIKRPLYRPLIGTPYAYYPFDLDADDYSGNSRDLTLGYDLNSTTLLPGILAPGGQSGNSLQIADDNALAYRTSSGVSSYTTDYTISIWICPDNLTAARVFYSELDPTSNLTSWAGIMLSVNTDGTVTVAIHRLDTFASILSQASATALTSGVWSHIAFASSAAGAGVLYINGAADASNFAYTPAGTYPTIPTLGIGGHYPAATPSPNAHFIGKIDEVSLFASKLSAGNISSIYSGTPTRDNYGRAQAQSYNYQRNISCHFSDHRLPGAITSGKEGLIFQIEYTKQQPICILPYASRPHVLDTIVNEDSGVEYEVESVEDAAGQGQHWRAFLKRFE